MFGQSGKKGKKPFKIKPLRGDGTSLYMQALTMDVFAEQEPELDEQEAPAKEAQGNRCLGTY